MAPDRFLPALLLAATAARGATQAPQPPPPAPLGDLSLEELGNVEVSLVSRRPESLLQAAASVYVITREDIRRSGATSLPEALRLAPTLEVAQVDAAQWAVSARGFNSTTANKLLVMIDGRSIYTPLYSGVFWDAQSLMLPDVERIEVVTGPGGTLWGSNAVNGVINVVTRHTKDTEGGLLVAEGGSRDWVRGLAEARQGGRLTDRLTYRVWGRAFERGPTERERGGSADDAWRKAQAGFRTDWAREGEAFTVQGDGYKGTLDQPRTAVPGTERDKTIEGMNLLGRWSRTGKASSLQVQAYYDHSLRDYPGTYRELRDTVDLDLQHRFRLGTRHEIVWGGGYRGSRDEVGSSAVLAFLPARSDHRLSNLFVQDTMAFLGDRMHLSLGSKLEHNDYTGAELQPSGHLSWLLKEDQLLWAAVSRAVRTPSRIDRDFYFSSPGLSLAGGPNFTSESLLAYELGWRRQGATGATWSVSPFYHVYKDIRSLERVSGNTLVIANGTEGKSWGLEAWADIPLTSAWRLKPGYTFLHQDLRPKDGSGSTLPSTAEGNDPRHHVTLTSLWDLGHGVELDGTLRRVSPLPMPPVPGYTALDLHLGWKPRKDLELALLGRNLFAPRHPEFGNPATREVLGASAMVKVAWTF